MLFMRKILTKRNAIIAAVAGSILLTGVGLKAVAEGGDGQRGGDITLDAMLEKVGERFDNVDTDGDGVITQAEAEAKAAEGGDRMLRRAASMFDRADTNNDGVLNADDENYDRISARLGLEGDVTLEQVQAGIADRMNAWSSDDTYPQTRADALAAAEVKFAEADTNGDGVLSGEERPDRGHGGRGHKGERGDRGERAERGDS